jgi:hypothetical protein
VSVGRTRNALYSLASFLDDVCRRSSAAVSRVGRSAELAESAEKERIGGLATIVVTLVDIPSEHAPLSRAD